MSTDKEFVVKLLLKKAADAPERYDGYHKELQILLADVVQYEREHQVARTNIVQKISDKIELLAEELERAVAKRNET